MYYLLYGFLYLVSLLPFFILYRISDLVCFFLYYFPGYRKNVVMANLEVAFPEKTISEKKEIARKFYGNLADTFVETIKLLSMSDGALRKRAIMELNDCNELIKKGKNLQFHSGHQMNWEYANLAFSRGLAIGPARVYLRINNKAVDRLFLKIRSRYKGALIPAQNFRSHIRQFNRSQYALGLVADQSPPNGDVGHWLYFFNKPTAFLTGPDKGGRQENMAIVFVNFIKEKRGFYRFVTEIVAENGSDFKEGELTCLYRDFLERCIRDRPDNYLWTHRRWKFEYKPEYRSRWVDKKSPER